MRLNRALVLLCLPFFGGCALFQQVVANNLEKPSLAFKGASLSDVSLEGATMNLTFLVDNPNDRGLSLAQSDYKLAIEGRDVAVGRPPQGLQIKPKGQTEVTLPAQFRYVDVANSVLDVLQKGTAKYSAQGTLGVDTPFGLVSLPFTKTGDVELPKPPQVSVGSPRLKNLTLTGATLEVPLKLANPNSIGLPLGAVTGALSIAGSKVGTIAADALGVIGGKATKEVAVPLTVHFADAFAAASALREGRADIGFVGELKAGSTSLPFRFEQELPIEK